MQAKPSRSKYTILKQVCELIPTHMVSQCARAHDVVSRKYSPWSHVVSMVFAQIAHSLSLNDVCDCLRHHVRQLWQIRGAVPPSKNGLSHANKKRSAEMIKDLFWAVLNHYDKGSTIFGREIGKLPRRFRRCISLVDSSTIALFANCMDWAQHRRQKAAAKLHLRLNLKTLLPQYVLVGSAKRNDNYHAPQLCAGLRSGEIVVFDRAYVDFGHLQELSQRGVFWVTRSKKNLLLHCVKRNKKHPSVRILRDDLVVLSKPGTKEKYPQRFRRVTAMVEVDGRDQEMVFLTNNLTWSAQSVCDLYKSRWAIEVFFKQMKQVLRLTNFLGHSKNAIQWQVWSALLVYILLRYLFNSSNWEHSFRRLLTLIRGTAWSNLELSSLLKSYGTAPGQKGPPFKQKQLFLPGMAPI